jgi:hypothetical protein
MHQSPKRLYYLAVCFVSIFLVYQILYVVVVAQKTGVLDVRSSEPKSQISISRVDKGVQLIGTGSARIRLAPGTYQLYAIYAGRHTISFVTVQKKHTANSYLNLSSSPTLPTVDSIMFVSINSLLDYGVSAPQLSNLKQAIFQFSNSIKKVIVDPNTVSTAPHDPNSDSILNAISFAVVIDGKSYNATMNYYSLGDNIRLYLYSPQTNAVVYDSGATSAQAGD